MTTFLSESKIKQQQHCLGFYATSIRFQLTWSVVYSPDSYVIFLFFLRDNLKPTCTFFKSLDREENQCWQLRTG